MDKKIWTKEEIVNLLNTNDKFVCHSLMVLYSFQTADEKVYGEANCINGAGFNGTDAKILTSFAEFYNEKGFLSRKQMEIAKKRIVKYAGQLVKYANNK